MNKKELNILKKELRSEYGTLVLDKTCIVTVDPSGSVASHNIVKLFHQPIQQLIQTGIEKMLSGTPCKSSNQYDIVYSEVGECLSFNLLENLESSNERDRLISSVVEAMKPKLQGVFYNIFITYCSYTPAGDDPSDYNFLAVTINRMFTKEEEYMVRDGVLEMAPGKLIVNPKPLTGFIYPAFDYGGSNVNSIVIYESRPAKPQGLETAFNLKSYPTPQTEKNLFQNLVSLVFGSSLTYQKVIALNSTLHNMLQKTKEVSTPVELSVVEVEDIFRELDAPEDSLKNIREIWKQCEIPRDFRLVNIFDNRIKIKSEGVAISFSSTYGQPLRELKFNGQECLAIDISQDTVVNELPVGGK
jgi:hypothetical protein